MNAPYAEKRAVPAAASVGGSFARAGRWSITHVTGGRRKYWAAVALILIGLLAWMMWPAPDTRNHTAMDAATPVGVAATARGDIHVTLDALGAVTPLATVTVKPEVSGIIQRIDFREGQTVRAGDVLAEIDARPYQAALDQARGTLARDQAQYANAQIDLQRYQALWAQGAVSQQILATQAALVRTDAGTVEADRGAVEAAAVNLGYCRIASPVGGRIGLRQVDPGNYVQVGVTAGIAVVTELQPMSVLFTLPEDDIAQVMNRLRSGAQIAVDAFDRSETTRIASGVLATADNEIDPATGTVKLRALFDNSDNRLFPNQFVNVRLFVETLHNQTTVPTAAIQHGASGNFVFLVKSDKTVSMRAVSLGPADGEMIDVARGLIPGEQVVVDGADRLRDGARVLIPGSGSLPPAKTNLQGRRHHHHGNQGGDGGG